MLLTDYEQRKVFKIARYKCLQSFSFHTKYFFYHQTNQRFQMAEHHIMIVTALEMVLEGKMTRLIINIAPRYGKTELAVKQFITHGLALNPAAKFIHLSYSDRLALDNSEDARQIVKSKEYQDLFPYVKIKPTTDSKKKWSTTSGGGVYATSTGGQVTGFGAGRVDPDDEIDDDELDKYVQELVSDIEGIHLIEKKQKFAGAIIIDDPIKPEDADSELKRDRVNSRYISTLQNRVNSRKTPIVVIMQRLHENDLCGFLIENQPDKWHVLSLPCIKEDGTPLWPHKHTLEELQQLEADDPVMFSRQYMQNPMPKEGLSFPETELRTYDPTAFDPSLVGEYCVGAIDPADEGTDALSFPLGYLVGEDFYVTDIVYSTSNSTILEPLIQEQLARCRPNAIDWEGNGGWAYFGKTMRTRMTEYHNSCEFRIFSNSANKRVRIAAQEGFIVKNFVFRGDYKTNPEQNAYRKFMHVLTRFPKVKREANEKDDAPDSLAILAKHLNNKFSHIFNKPRRN